MACASLALAISGCSSSTSASAKIDAAFVAKVDQACSANVARYPPAGTFPYSNFNPDDPPAAELPAVGAYFAENQRGVPAFEAALAALGEPSTGSSAWDKVKALAFSFLTIAAAQKNDALAGNVSGFVAEVAKSQPALNELETAAKRAGLPVTGSCAQEF